MKGNYTTRLHLRKGFTFLPSFNTDIRRLCPRDEEIVNRFRDGSFVSPLIVEKVENMGYCLITTRKILKREFLCFYAGDVISQAYATTQGLS